MYKIGVCDDNVYFLNEIVNILKDFYKECNDVKIEKYQNAIEILRYFREFDLIFLDIEMPTINGLALKRKLEEIDFRGKIIYVTDYEQYMNEAFGKNVIAYIPKKDLNRIVLMLQQLEKEKKRNKVLRIADANINISDIYYIQADSGYVNIYTGNELFYFSIYLNDILKRIDDITFMQVHRSYIVNFRYIDTFNANEITLINGKKIKLSRKYKEVFKNSYFKYLKGE